MKRLTPLVIIALLAVVLAGCGGGGSQTGGERSNEGSGFGSGGIATIEDLQATLEADHAGAPWLGDITGMTLETYLGAPTVVIHVRYSTADPDFETQNANRNALVDALQPYDIAIAPNVVLLDADGRIWPAAVGAGAVPMAEAFDLPPSPTTADGVKQWLAQVYGPGGLIELGPKETWYAAIKRIEVSDPWGQGDMLSVTTDLPTYNSEQASLLQYALLTTGSPLLVKYEIKAKDGTGSVGGVGGMPDGPGYSGFYYLTK